MLGAVAKGDGRCTRPEVGRDLAREGTKSAMRAVAT